MGRKLGNQLNGPMSTRLLVDEGQYEVLWESTWYNVAIWWVRRVTGSGMVLIVAAPSSGVWHAAFSTTINGERQEHDANIEQLSRLLHSPELWHLARWTLAQLHPDINDTVKSLI